MTGLIHSDVAGRTDRLPVVAPVGGWVCPADVVSGLGQGNTLAGAAILDHVLGIERGAIKRSAGGSIPIIVAGGEYFVPPEIVAKVGGGDMKRGHDTLDKMAANVRRSTIKTLAKLPKPKR